MTQYVLNVKDGFTSVIPCVSLPEDEVMAKIARENGYSETTFVVRKSFGVYDLKVFTKEGEKELSGNATLATSFIVNKYIDRDISYIEFYTLAGKLKINRKETEYTLKFPVGMGENIVVDLPKDYKLEVKEF
jgi:Predicted epimerase, PhzC/PhzF homolog